MKLRSKLNKGDKKRTKQYSTVQCSTVQYSTAYHCVAYLSSQREVTSADQTVGGFPHCRTHYHRAVPLIYVFLNKSIRYT